jgi:hypothetical protein
MSKRPARDPESVVDLRWAVPVAMVFLLMPPMLTVFDNPILIIGIPLLHLYMFAVWFAGIVATAFLSHRLGRSDGGPGVPPRDGG